MVSHQPLPGRPLTRGEPGQEVEEEGGAQDDDDGRDERGAALDLSLALVVAGAPVVLGQVHGVQHVETDPVQVGELLAEEIFLVEILETVVLSLALSAGFTGISSTTGIRVQRETVFKRLVQSEESLCVVCEDTLVVEGGAVAGGTKPFGP